MCEKNNDKKCGSCKYFGWDNFGRAHVCVNADSEHVADFVTATDSCEYHEEAIKVLDVENLRKWIETQEKGIRASNETYAVRQAVLYTLEILAEYVDENSKNFDEIGKLIESSGLRA